MKRVNQLPIAIKKEVRLKWRTLTNDQLLTHLIENFDYQLGKTTLRNFMYSNGMKKTNCFRWKQTETDYLLKHYQSKGNIEIAKKLSTKRRPVTKKNVEKKMKLLGIKRTAEEKLLIIGNHKKQGTYSRANYKRWEQKKIPEEGLTITVRNGRPTYMIKVDGILTPYPRHRYAQLHGQIEPGMRIHYKDCNPLNIDDSNFELRRGCSYSKLEQTKYNRYCRDYIITAKLKENTTAKNVTSPVIKPTTVGIITLRINEKTVIQVKPGTNIEKIKEKYSVQRMLSNAKQ